jgi:membrane fusion protein, multidrug efflux system
LKSRRRTGGEAGRRRPGSQAVGSRLLVILLLFLLAAGCGEKEEARKPERRQVPVVTEKVKATTVLETVQGIGTLAALKAVEIRPEISGLVREIGFEEAAMVEEGSVLYRLSDEKLQRELSGDQSALQAARSRLELARQTLERRRDLVERQLISREQFEQFQSELNQAEAEVAQLQARIELTGEQIKDTVLRAPFSGLVSESLVDIGELVDQGQVLTTIYFPDILEMEFTVPERYSGQLTKGQAVEVTVTAFPEQRFAGQVSFVSPAVSEETRDFKVKARIDNRRQLLKPGSFGRALVVLAARENRPVIPEEALVGLREGYAIFVVQEGIARQRNVQTGLRQPGQVEIVEGLQPGEVVVRSGHMQLADGDPVREVNASR